MKPLIAALALSLFGVGARAECTLIGTDTVDMSLGTGNTTGFDTRGYNSLIVHVDVTDADAGDDLTQVSVGLEVARQVSGGTWRPWPWCDGSLDCDPLAYTWQPPAEGPAMALPMPLGVMPNAARFDLDTTGFETSDSIAVTVEGCK